MTKYENGQLTSIDFRNILVYDNCTLCTGNVFDGLFGILIVKQR